MESKFMLEELIKFLSWSKTENLLILVQTIALVIATGAAIWIGCVQNRINDRLYELQTAVSVIFEVKEDRVLLKNVGNSNINLLRVSFDKGRSHITWDDPGIVVTPNGTQRVFHYDWKKIHSQYIVPNARFPFDFTLYLKDINEQIYTLKAVVEIELDEFSAVKETMTNILKLEKTGSHSLIELH